MHRIVRSAVSLLVVLGAGNASFADQAAVNVQVPSSEPFRTANVSLQFVEESAANIVIDGRLDEAAWSVAPVNKPLRVTEPDTLAPSEWSTDFRIFYTMRGVYVSFDMVQPEGTLVERITARDNVNEVRDRVTVNFDMSGSGLYGYWMSIALGDNLMDGTLLPERQYSREWDGAWYGASQRTDNGWSAEAFVPWSQMSMPAATGERRIGLQISRRVGSRNETWSWPALPSSRASFISEFPKVTLQGVNPRSQWSVFPYASSTYDRIDQETRFKAGADLFWRPSTNLQLTATLNPDFGSVESDDVTVNLTADETFFPEKRLFFLEGQNIFNTTSRATSGSQRFTTVNTRRIGGRARRPTLPPGTRLPLRQAIQHSDLLGAAKVTGQRGALRFGLLGALEDDSTFTVDGTEYLQDGRTFGALRVLYENSEGDTYRGLGMISTIVTHPDADAVVHAADFKYLGLDGRWGVDGQVLTSDRDESGRGYGAYADITYNPRQGLTHKLELTAFDDTLNVNDFGFQRRNDVREAWYSLEWVKSGFTRIRDFTISPFIRYEVNGDGYRTNNALASSFNFKLNSLDEIEVFGAYFPQRYDDRNSFGNGVFDVATRRSLSILYRTNTAKPVSVYGKVNVQEEFVGDTTYEAQAGVVWQPYSNFRIDLKATWFDRNGWLLHQEDRNFTAFNARQWQPALSVDYFPTARQHLSAGLQWVGIRAQENEFYELAVNGTALTAVPKPPGPADDFGLSQLSFQLRYRWQIAPLSDLYVVYTKGDSRRRDFLPYSDLFRDSWSEPLEDQLVIKLRYRLGS